MKMEILPVKMRRVVVLLVVGGLLGWTVGGLVQAMGGARIFDTHPQTGVVWSSAVDPTIAPGVQAPPWQFLIRTDTDQLYFKSGTTATAWTALGGGGGGGTVTSVACGTNMSCAPSPIVGAGTVAVIAAPTFAGDVGALGLNAGTDGISSAGDIDTSGGHDIVSNGTVQANTSVQAGTFGLFGTTITYNNGTTPVGILAHSGTPNGVITATKGSLNVDFANAALYQNTDGAMAWSQLGASATTAPSDIYGDASDGNVTISADTTLARDMYYDTLTVNVGKTLTTGGFRIFARTAIVNNGVISDKGGDAVLNTLGTGAALGTLPGGRDGGQGVPGNGQPGVDGGKTPRGYGGTGGAHGTFPSNPGNPGGIGAGGGGGTSTATQGGDGGLAGAVLTAVQGDIGLAIFAIWGAGIGQGANTALGNRIGGGGASGGGDSFGGTGGGGGGSSGYSVIASPLFTGTGNINSNGGKGGDGGVPVFGCTNGGGGGGGGYLVIIKGVASTSPTATATGGLAGAANGAGCFPGGAGGDGVVRTYLSGP